ncbi:ATP-binding protein [Olleya sp. YS]|uniref:sensor histidine kinase n=1 Tax=Olleya sp. YS TaxID=3028318 RepID=UPI0024342C09|nr:ATP-binding protein [Olleya sp. YS]WGD34685.1 histidine kinase [Olleya sp. YS]
MISLYLQFQNLDSPMSSSSERYLLAYMIGILLIVCTLIILFFVVFQKRKNKLILDKVKQQKAFEEELTNTQIEIQEQTLKNIGQELHDNVGQILSVANMNMSILNTQVPETIKASFTETKNAVKEGLSELRLLSKTLNSDVIANRGFIDSVKSEVERLNKLKLLEASVIIEGNPEFFNQPKDSIILFRIVQEFISNTVKYADAETLKINLNFSENKLLLSLKDNGVGFDEKTIDQGSGLINMKSRAALINADLNLSSTQGNGVQLTLTYPYRNLE